ncbi:hypothetical protein GH714_014727 [Hevea brasiliensis]|uniref:Myb-like domain-containing protein n=1 Tax=Hevea brasiliensis TaxID=3981 RepID=A0A6A6KU52_HEVBR|nr:hypothetical protein GH714_014727 [Hevea brasiliensis]
MEILRGISDCPIRMCIDPLHMLIVEMVSDGPPDVNCCEYGGRFDFEYEHKKKKTKRHEANGDDVELSATDTGAVGLDGDIDLISQKVRKRDKACDAGWEIGASKENLKEGRTGVGEKVSLQKDGKKYMERNFESGVLKYRKKKHKEKKSKDKNENGRNHLDENIMDHDESARMERKQKKQQLIVNLEAKSLKLMAETPGNFSNAIEENGGNIDSGEDENLGAHAFNAEDGRKDERKRKKRKRDKDVSDTGTMINEINQKDVGNIMEKETMNGKLGNKSNPMGENEGNEYSIENKVGGGKIEDHTVKKVKKKKKVKSVVNGSEGKGSDREQRMGKGVEGTNPLEKSTLKGTSKRVSFSEEVEVFPLSDDGPSSNTVQKEEVVRGKRFSHEEDEMVKEAVLNYMDAHGLGEEGLQMVLNCKKYPELKNCWKEIGAALPWRPYLSVYNRAHILFERDEKGSWTPEEYELVHKFHEKTWLIGKLWLKHLANTGFM